MHRFSYFDYNWLAIKINNRTTYRMKKYFKGVVYDLGCGERDYEKEILTVAKKYVGVDWSSTLHNLKADIVADLNLILPVESEVADTVLSFQVLEHLREPQLMLHEAFRILKPGGYMIITVPFQWWVHEAPFDYYRYTPYGLKYLFEKAGFQNVIVEPTSGFFTMWILKLNYFTARVSGPRYVRWPVKLLFIPFWFLGQMVAPLLDNLDRNKELEAGGYVVIAKRS